MAPRQKILLATAVVALFSLLIFILFSDNGLADFLTLKSERDRLCHENAALRQENMRLYRTIERLKNDPAYIESVARRELGMIKKEELIFKPKRIETDQKQRRAKE